MNRDKIYLALRQIEKQVQFLDEAAKSYRVLQMHHTANIYYDCARAITKEISIIQQEIDVK